MTDWSDEETDDPLYADRRKVEKWSRDGLRIEQLLYAGNDLDKARRKHACRPTAGFAHEEATRIAANIAKLSELRALKDFVNPRRASMKPPG